jgi:hypothetical protein
MTEAKEPFRIQLVTEDDQPMLRCPDCKADLTDPESLFVSVSDGDRMNPKVEILCARVQSDGFLPDKDEDDYEFDHGKEVETQCSKCECNLNKYFKTKHN